MLGLVALLAGVHCRIIENAAFFVYALSLISLSHTGSLVFITSWQSVCLYSVFTGARLVNRVQLSAAWHCCGSSSLKTEKRKQKYKLLEEFSWGQMGKAILSDTLCKKIQQGAIHSLDVRTWGVIRVEVSLV